MVDLDTQEQNKYIMRKKIQEEENSDNCLSEEMSEQIIFGSWRNTEAVAADLWGGVHSTLLESTPFFAYKSVKQGSDLIQVVVVSYTDAFNNFGIGMVTTGFSMLLPHVPVEYLEDVLVADLKKYKVETKIIDTFEQLITNYKNLHGKNNFNINNK